MAQVEESCLQDWKRSELREHLLSTADRPVVFRRCLDTWTVARGWNPVAVSRLLGEKETLFKLCPQRGSEEYRRRFCEKDTIFETQCLHVRATLTQFAEWLENAAKINNSATNTMQKSTLSSDDTEPLSKKSRTDKDHHNPLLIYSPSQYWIYADYKYMIQLCDGHPELMQAIDWSVLGFDERSGADSTLWVGSKGAYTPCHYDTYGCNIVAQLWGVKKWTLYSPHDSVHLYPTRVPYEESSVFSAVNVTCPNLERHPDFTGATSYHVELEAGDVLFVPKKWWHYVECMENAVSVNTWVDLPSDSYERVKEAIVRTTIAGWLTTSDNHEYSDIVNPNEEIFSHKTNLELLSTTLSDYKAPPTHQKPHPPPRTITHHDWLNAVTSNAVVETIVDVLVTKHQQQKEIT